MKQRHALMWLSKLHFDIAVLYIVTLLTTVSTHKRTPVRTLRSWVALSIANPADTFKNPWLSTLFARMPIPVNLEWWSRVGKLQQVQRTQVDCSYNRASRASQGTRQTHVLPPGSACMVLYIPWGLNILPCCACQRCQQIKIKQKKLKTYPSSPQLKHALLGLEGHSLAGWPSSPQWRQDPRNFLGLVHSDLLCLLKLVLCTTCTTGRCTHPASPQLKQTEGSGQFLAKWPGFLHLLIWWAKRN